MPPWEVPWLDATGRDTVVVRLSRGAGLPAPLPDVLGMAIRLPREGGPVDLLLSTAGRGAFTRLVPFPRRDTAAGYSSVMGYRSDAGVLRLAAFPDRHHVPAEPGPLTGAVAGDGPRFTLVAAKGLGSWRPFGRLHLRTPTDPRTCAVRFDAVLNPPPGLVPDGPMARFRAPAYARARAEGHE